MTNTFNDLFLSLGVIFFKEHYICLRVLAGVRRATYLCVFGYKISSLSAVFLLSYLFYTRNEVLSKGAATLLCAFQLI